MAREAAYDLCEDLRPERTTLVALAKLVVGDEQARERVRTCPAVTIDGCKLMCASKLVTHSGGAIAQEIAVLDVYKRHKELKPDGIAVLNEPGRRLARALAEEAAAAIDQLQAGPASGGRHA